VIGSRGASLGGWLGAPGAIRQRAWALAARLPRARTAVLAGGALAVALLTLRFDAPVVIAALLAAFGLVVLVLRPALATVVTLFLIYSNIPVVAVRQLGVPPLLAASSVLLLGLPLAHYMLLQQKRLRSDRTLALMLLLLGVMSVSATFAKAADIATLRIVAYLVEGIALYWLVLNVVRDLPSFRRVVWTVLTAGGLLSALGIWQAVTDTHGRSFGGLAHREVVVLRADQGLDEETVHMRISKRAEGPVDEPNRFAQILIVLLPLAVYTFRCAGSRTKRVLAVLAGGLVLAGVFLTYSRGAFLMLVALTALAVRLRWLRPGHVAALCAAALVALPLIAPTYYERVASIAGVRGLMENQARVQADGAIRGRATEMLSALHVFADHPVIGVGPGLYAPVYSVEYQSRPGVAFRDLRVQRRAHSLYFELAAELGAIGLALFLAMVGLQLRDLLRGRKRARSKEMSELSTALALGLLAYLGTALFLHLAYERYFWLLLALTSAGLRLVREDMAAVDGGGDEGRRSPVTPPPGRSGSRFGRKRLATLASTIVVDELGERARSTRQALAHRWTGVACRAAAASGRVAAWSARRARALETRGAALAREVQSRFVFRTLDAVVTAPLAPRRATGLAQVLLPLRQPHYRRVQSAVNYVETLCPRLIRGTRRWLVRSDRLALTGYRGPEPLGFGAACTAFNLPAQPAVDCRTDAVLRVVRSTLGRPTQAATAAAREARGRYRRISRLYQGGDLILPTSFLVMHTPLLGRTAAVSIQPRLPEDARDLFADFTDVELLTVMRGDPAFAGQLRFFVIRTAASVRSLGRCVDLVGRGNVLVVSTPAGPRLRIIDFGELNLADWAVSKPLAEAELRSRLARMERLCRLAKALGVYGSPSGEHQPRLERKPSVENQPWAP
jgi:hypothetical protein